MSFCVIMRTVTIPQTICTSKWDKIWCVTVKIIYYTIQSSEGCAFGISTVIAALGLINSKTRFLVVNNSIFRVSGKTREWEMAQEWGHKKGTRICTKSSMSRGKATARYLVQKHLQGWLRAHSDLVHGQHNNGLQVSLTVWSCGRAFNILWGWYQKWVHAVKPQNKVHIGDGPHVRQIQTNQAMLGLVPLDLNYHYVWEFEVTV